MRKIRLFSLAFLSFMLTLSLSLSFVTFKTQKASASTQVFEMVYGASLRLTGGKIGGENGDDITNGLRFQVKMDETTKNSITETNKLYMLICPKDILNVSSATDDNLLTYKDKWVDLGIPYAVEDEYYANGVLCNVKNENLSREFNAIAFFANDTKTEITLRASTANSVARSIYNVVNSAVLDSQNDFAETILGSGAELTYNTWYGSENYPIVVNDTSSYDALVDLINEGKISLTDKNFKVDSGATTSKEITNNDNRPSAVVEISTKDQFVDFLRNITKYKEDDIVKLTTDLDFTDYNNYGSNIARAAQVAFYGTFDGQNHIIKNYDYSKFTGAGGMFGDLGNRANGISGHVKNVAIIGATINNTNSYFVAGNIFYQSTIENVYVQGENLGGVKGVARLSDGPNNNSEENLGPNGNWNAKIKNTVANIQFTNVNGTAFGDGTAKNFATLENCYAITNGKMAPEGTNGLTTPYSSVGALIGDGVAIANSSFTFNSNGIYYNNVLVVNCSSFTVSFSVDGETYDTQTVLEGNKATKPTVDPSKTDYVFAGWFVDDTEYNFNSIVTSNITVKAKFIPEGTKVAMKAANSGDANTGYYGVEFFDASAYEVGDTLKVTMKVYENSTSDYANLGASGGVSIWSIASKLAKTNSGNWVEISFSTTVVNNTTYTFTSNQKALNLTHEGNCIYLALNAGKTTDFYYKDVNIEYVGKKVAMQAANSGDANTGYYGVEFFDMGDYEVGDTVKVNMKIYETTTSDWANLAASGSVTIWSSTSKTAKANSGKWIDIEFNATVLNNTTYTFTSNQKALNLTHEGKCIYLALNAGKDSDFYYKDVTVEYVGKSASKGTVNKTNSTAYQSYLGLPTEYAEGTEVEVSFKVKFNSNVNSYTELLVRDKTEIKWGSGTYVDGLASKYSLKATVAGSDWYEVTCTTVVYSYTQLQYNSSFDPIDVSGYGNCVMLCFINATNANSVATVKDITIEKATKLTYTTGSGWYNKNETKPLLVDKELAGKTVSIKADIRLDSDYEDVFAVYIAIVNPTNTSSITGWLYTGLSSSFTKGEYVTITLSNVTLDGNGAICNLSAANWQHKVGNTTYPAEVANFSITIKNIVATEVA